MNKTKYIKTSSIPILVILVAFFFLYAAYFFIYIPQQESLVEKRANRILKEYAGNMQEKLKYYETHFKNYSPYYTLKYLSQDDSDHRDSVEAGIIGNLQVKTLMSNLDYKVTTVTFSNLTVDKKIIFVNGDCKIIFEGAPVSDVRIVLDSLLPACLKNHYIGDSSLQKVHLLPVSTFMENLKFDRLLENIALISDSASLYSSNPEMVHDITNPGLLTDTLKRLQGSFSAQLNIRGEDRYIMVMPFTFLGNRLYLAGFISSRDFRQITRNINSQFLIMLAGVLLLFLFGMPVMKIFFLGRNDQLRAADGTASLISLIFGIGFFVLIILSVMKQFVADRQILRKRINDISLTLYNNVSKDIHEITQLYENIADTTKITVFDTLLVDTIRSTFLNSLINSQNGLGKNNLPDAIGKIPEDSLNKGFPLNEVFLINDDGYLKKVVSRTGASSAVPVDLSQRNYFRKMREDGQDPWFYKRPDHSIQRYFMESVKSYNSGKKEAAFSFRLDTKSAGMYRCKILAITSPLPSLFNQVLPEDVSFLIMDNTGNVLFHADQSKNLHENFLRECGDNIRIISSMDHRVADIIRVHYNEKDWLAKIVPLRDAPLFHITLIDYSFKHNKNARILFFTFYFMFATFMLTLCGIGIIYISRLKSNKTLSGPWIFNWLFYKTENYRSYSILLIIQIILIMAQLSGLVINDTPVTLFLYQNILIILSTWAALVVLGNHSDNRMEYKLTAWRMPQVIFLALVIFYTVIIVFLKENLLIEYIISFLIVLALIFPLTAKWFLTKDPPGAIMYEPDNNESPVIRKELYGRKVYHAYVFLLLMSMSAIPAIQYYRSVKMQEDSLWKRKQLEYAAKEIREFKDFYTAEKRGEDWYKRASGEGIDALTIRYCCDNKELINDTSLTPANWFYSLLPDPVTQGNHLIGLLKNAGAHLEWKRGLDKKSLNQNQVNDDILCYSGTGNESPVRVEKTGRYKFTVFGWLLYFTLPGILVLVILWFLYRYVAGIVLHTPKTDWEFPVAKPWETLLKQEYPARILLLALNHNHYLDRTKKMDVFRAAEYTHDKLEVLNIFSLLSHKDEKEFTESGKVKMLWLTGLGELIQDPEKVLELMPVLTNLTGKCSQKLVVVLPFGTDFILERYNELLREFFSDPGKSRMIKNALYMLENYFGNFYQYQGSVSDSDTINPVPFSGSGYRFFWSNLTNPEKLLLIDLSEDEMLNYKNKNVINQLYSKGLIKLAPSPQIFSEGFKHFINEVVDPLEARELQFQLKRQGNWHNLRYLILFILIPLLIFIFIAQGTSIEKVIALTTGGLAVLTGILRLSESDIFRKGAKA